MLMQPSASSPLWLVLCWLASWRLTTLLCYEAGPFDLVTRLRVGLARIGLHRVIRCFHCLSFWISGVLVLIVYERRAASILLWLGVAGAVSLSERLVGPVRDEEEKSDG